MDNAEKQAEAYLAHLGYDDIVHHPDGDVTPDFLVNSKIAVEVTRLKQKFKSSTGSESLDTIAITLRQKFESLLPSYGPPLSGESWFVLYDFRRPIDKKAAKHLEKELSRFKNSPTRHAQEQDVCQGVKIEYVKTSKPGKYFFVLGGYMDIDAGGWMTYEMLKSVQESLDIKAEKALKCYSRYPEWWIIMVNHIDPTFNLDDLAEVRRNLQVPSVWHRMILLDPRNYRLSWTL